MHLTHNIEIKIFDDVVRHFALEKDQMESSRPKPKAYVADVKA